MSQNVAPWLQGLDADVTWELPVKVSSASHDASALPKQPDHPNSSLRRVSRQSSNGSRTMGSVMRTSVQRKRSPLTAISGNDHAADTSTWGTTKLGGTRSVSTTSAGSVIQCGTVQQRPKSESPPKKQETLEWKRRLMRGQLGYGDQTDLFGPSGLENIFAQPQVAADATKSESRSKMAWKNRHTKFNLPSSPPVWNAPSASHRRATMESVLDAGVDGEVPAVGFACADSQDLSSDPFAIEHSYRSSTPLTKPLGATITQHGGLGLPVVDGGAGDRTIGGPTELEQEDFSPVFVSKHTTTDGQIDYQALDSHKVSQFQQQNVNLRHSGLFSDTQEESVSLQHESERYHVSDETNANVDLSLSEDLPTGTPVVLPLDSNVQLRRGGYSNQGSFKERPLSSSNSALDTENKISLGYKVPAIALVEPEGYPLTPDRVSRAEHAGRSSGSPLKLFGTHDTFTNNRLLRRMSELNVSSSPLGHADYDEDVRGPEQGDSVANPPDVLDASFGSGALDEHDFAAEISITSPIDPAKSSHENSPGSEISPPGSKAPTQFRFEQSPIEKPAFRLRSKIPTRIPNTEKQDDSILGPNSNVPTPSRRLALPTLETSSKLQPKRDVLLDGALNVTATKGSTVNIVIQKTVEPAIGAGKRPPNSPCKDSTPKRRRTLHASELQSDDSDHGDSVLHHVHDAALSRKRKDARQGDTTNIADPDVLASRKLLQPRSISPKQLRQQQIEAQIREMTEDFATQEPDALEAVLDQIESSMASNSPQSIQQQARTVANEVAKFTLRIQKASGDHGERKRSVTTQDFFNEAVMVMKLIRERAARQSGLGSVAESDHERVAQSHFEDYSELDNSALSVSRPPSREGAIPWRPRTSQQTNARVISHLRKFQEEEDDDDHLAPSFAELHLDDEQIYEDEPDSEISIGDELKDEEEQESEILIEDEESSIRIRGPRPSATNANSNDMVSLPDSQRSDQQNRSVSTVASATVSTGRTQQTSSTRKSENVGTLAPDVVAHLIGEQVGSMTYDKERQQWVKSKHSPKKDKREHGSFLDVPSSLTTSDDDPFGEISDLPVDEQKEEQIRTASYDFKRHLDAHRSGLNGFTPTNNPQSHAQPVNASQQSHAERPATRDSNKSIHTYTTADGTHLTALTSSQAPIVETRATSWANDDIKRADHNPSAEQQSLAQGHSEDVESREEPRKQFADVAEEYDMDASGDLHGEKAETTVYSRTQLNHNIYDDSVLDDKTARLGMLSSPKLRQSPSLPSMSRPSMFKTQPRQVSLRRKTLTSRFQAEQREESEVSFVANLPGERIVSVSVNISRPASNQPPAGQIVEIPASSTKEDASFMFSDLPEFTISGEEDERPSERQLATRLAQNAAAEANDRYALAVKDLVKTLTDVHEAELYWEDVKTLDLHDRSLASLHGLSDFCGGVQCMNVSNNKLNHLDGAPISIRVLSARSNQISNLTGWNHLANLQYLDISKNCLSNLKGLSGLVHLREIRADDNEITSLDAVYQMDGLLKLRLRRNKLRTVDFANSRLQRLEELDLCENEISSVHGLESLVSLKQLKLDGNRLYRMPELGKDLQHMHTLSLQECGLQELDVRRMPELRVLRLDGNRLRRIDGIENLKSLDTLSLRSQKLSPGSAIAILEQTNQARMINLSGNDISSLSELTPQLSLQHLELASVGLETLPDDFGIRLPNLKSLNINFNSLRDIRPLLNIQRLEHLELCGNRLGRLRKSVATFSRMPSLRSLDLRDNPLTQGFYVPPGTICSSSPTASAPAPSSIVPRTSHMQTLFALDDISEENRAAEETTAMRFRLLPADPAADKHHHARLDTETKLRRRVHHVLLATSCPKLAHADGLVFDKSNAMVKDEIWTRLVELGVVRKSGKAA